MIPYKELKKLKDQGRELYEKIEATKKYTNGFEQPPFCRVRKTRR